MKYLKSMVRYLESVTPEDNMSTALKNIKTKLETLFAEDGTMVTMGAILDKLEISDYSGNQGRVELRFTDSDSFEYNVLLEIDMEDAMDTVPEKCTIKFKKYDMREEAPEPQIITKEDIAIDSIDEKTLMDFTIETNDENTEDKIEYATDDEFGDNSEIGFEEEESTGFEPQA